jgi:hypothetical protein
MPNRILLAILAILMTVVMMVGHSSSLRSHYAPFIGFGSSRR